MKRHQVRRVLVCATAALGVFAACGPENLPDASDEARVSIDVGPDATGVVTIAVGGEPDDVTLGKMLDAVRGSVFGVEPATAEVVANGNLPIMRFTTTGVYRQGDSPAVEIDVRGLCDDLASVGVRRLEVALALPGVPHEQTIAPDQPEGDDSWPVQSCNDAPHGTVVMMPEPGRFWIASALLLIVVGANAALAVIGKRGLSVPRWLIRWLSIVGVLAALVVTVTQGARAGDHMEVAGRISHGANQVYFGLSLAVVLLGLLAAAGQPFYWRLPPERRPRLRRTKR